MTLCSISIGWIVHDLFEKYAPNYADDVDWKSITKQHFKNRRNAVVEIFDGLKRFDGEKFNDLCGALNIIRIVAESRRIKKHLSRLINVRGVAGKFSQSSVRRHSTFDGDVYHPVNIAEWFCIKETELREEWPKIKQLALKEDCPNYDWTTFCLEPRKYFPDEKRLSAFRNELFRIFKTEKSNVFPVKVFQLDETRTFIRFCVSTAKDPLETLLTSRGEIVSGNDPTANTFLIDYYFNCETLSITFPDVIEVDRVAKLFAEIVLGSKTSAEEPRAYLKSMRQYHAEEFALKKFEEIRKTHPDVKEIGIRAIKFTVAEDEAQAKLRRSEDKRKKNIVNKLPGLPVLRCEVDRGADVFAAIRELFAAKVQRKELVDVFEVTFCVTLYDKAPDEYLGRELRDMNSNTHSYSFSVTPRNVTYNPSRKDYVLPAHWQLISEIRSELVKNELVTETLLEESK